MACSGGLKQTEFLFLTMLRNIGATKKGTRGALGPPRRSKMGPIRSKIGGKDQNGGAVFLWKVQV